MPCPSETLLPGEKILPDLTCQGGLPATSRFMERIYREDEEVLNVIMTSVTSGILK